MSQVVGAIMLILVVLSVATLFVPQLVSVMRGKALNLSESERRGALRNMELLSYVYTNVYLNSAFVELHNYGSLPISIDRVYLNGVAVPFTVRGTRGVAWIRETYEYGFRNFSDEWKPVSKPMIYGRWVNASLTANDSTLLVHGSYVDGEFRVERREVYGGVFCVEFRVVPDSGSVSIAPYIVGNTGYVYGFLFNASRGAFDVLLGRGRPRAYVGGWITVGTAYTARLCVGHFDVELLLKNSTGTVYHGWVRREGRVFRLGFAQGSSYGSAEALIKGVSVSGEYPECRPQRVMGRGVWFLVVPAHMLPAELTVVTKDGGVFSWYVDPW